MSFRPQASVTAKQNIVDMLNHDNNTSYQVSDFLYGTPSVVLDNPFGNTNLTLTGNPSANKSGQVQLLYTRLDIGQFLSGSTFTAPSSDFTGMTSLSQALNEINTLFGLALQPYEIVDQSIDFTQVNSVTVVISSASEEWTPGSSFSFAVTGNNSGNFTGNLFITSGGNYFLTSAGNVFQISP